MITDILLDMDGVLVDFHSAALQVHRMKRLADNWPPGEWDMAEVMGLSDDEFWEPLDHYFFWRRIVRPFPGASFFYKGLCDMARVTVCTVPTRNPECMAAKFEVLRREFDYDVRLITCPDKYLMARSTTLLVDDRDKNVDEFRAAGGHAFLFPRPWNRDHDRYEWTGRPNPVEDSFNRYHWELRRISAEVLSHE